jgi:hypothetical protein
MCYQITSVRLQAPVFGNDVPGINCCDLTVPRICQKQISGPSKQFILFCSSKVHINYVLFSVVHREAGKTSSVFGASLYVIGWRASASLHNPARQRQLRVTIITPELANTFPNPHSSQRTLIQSLKLLKALYPPKETV